jgi:hypothetical protein
MIDSSIVDLLSNLSLYKAQFFKNNPSKNLYPFSDSCDKSIPHMPDMCQTDNKNRTGGKLSDSETWKKKVIN